MLVVDVETVEDRLVEKATLVVAAPAVQLLRVLQQLQANFDQAGTLGEIMVGFLEPFFQMLPLPLDLAQFRLDLGLRDGAVGREVDEVLLTRVQSVQLSGELLVEEPG
ncbi:hypothetical protein [Streptomyces aquilus]|uniref:hypothetical protein n=1 Tax=Streptomyces aquilus TaxID=2548456 RepID=UPI0036765CF6